MANHPNRGRTKSPAANPRPDEIRAARETAGLTQTDAAASIHCQLRTWQDWEAGKRRMHPAFWELWQRKPARRLTKGGGDQPDAQAVRTAREAAGLTQTQAAALIHSQLRSWQDWEAGARDMHPGFWELWRLKAAR
jgi:putative transcriptional regulator